MRKSLRTFVAFAPGCALLAAALLLGSRSVPLPAGAAPGRAALHLARRAAEPARYAEPLLRRDPFAPPAGIRVSDERLAPAPAAASSAAPAPLPIVRALVTGARRMALLDAGGTARVAGVGERIGAWRVESIDDDGVVLARDPHAAGPAPARVRLGVEKGR